VDADLLIFRCAIPCLVYEARRILGLCVAARAGSSQAAALTRWPRRQRPMTTRRRLASRRTRPMIHLSPSRRCPAKLAACRDYYRRRTRLVDRRHADPVDVRARNRWRFAPLLRRDNGSYEPATYSFDDVVRRSGVQPHDWAEILRHASTRWARAPLRRPRAGGYKLGYTDTHRTSSRARSAASHTDPTYSLGMVLGREARITACYGKPRLQIGIHGRHPDPSP